MTTDPKIYTAAEVARNIANLNHKTKESNR